MVYIDDVVPTVIKVAKENNLNPYGIKYPLDKRHTINKIRWYGENQVVDGCTTTFGTVGPHAFKLVVNTEKSTIEECRLLLFGEYIPQA